MGNETFVTANQVEDETSGQLKRSVSVVVTLFNEEGNVEAMTRNLIAAFRPVLKDVRLELVLVLNGSLDNTPQKARQLAKEFPEVVLVELATNQGYGGGIQAGLAAASGDVIGYTDADEQISAADAARVFQVALEGKYDLVKAVRGQREDGLQRRIVSTAYNGLFNVMFGFTSKDINAKPKVFQRQALKRMTLTSKDWFIDAEAMIGARRLGLVTHEVPIVFKARRHGSSNVRFSTILEFLKNMWKYRNDKH